jgi:cytochrome P450
MCHFISSTSETAAFLQNKPIIYPDTIFKLTERYRENERQGKFLREFHQRIIDERREVLRKNNNNEAENQEGSGYSIFIDHILNNEGMFSDEDIQHHVITVLSAGK